MKTLIALICLLTALEGAQAPASAAVTSNLTIAVSGDVGRAGPFTFRQDLNFVDVLRVALTHWFSQGNSMIPAPESGIVRVYCAGLGKSEQLDIPGVKTVVVSLEEAQLNVSDPKPKDYWIRVRDLMISGDEVHLSFHAKSAKYHKWASVFYKLRRSYKGWTVASSGADM